jgi:autotransporter-associated beta strand protein
MPLPSSATRLRAARTPSFFCRQRRAGIALAVTLAFPMPARPQAVTFTGSVSGELSTGGNWQGGSVPGPSAIATFSGVLTNPLTLTNSAISVQGLDFLSGASPTSLSLSSKGATPTALSIGALGVSNLSSSPESIVLASPNSALNLSGAGSTVTGPVSISNSSALSETSFLAGASAGSATITNTLGGSTEFNASSAGHAAITVGATSKVLFVAGANASQSSISVASSGLASFNDTSGAGSARINNAGSVVFAGTSSAAAATITNSGSLVLANAASLGQALVTSTGTINLSGTASAGAASLGNSGNVMFNDTSSAGSVHLVNAGTVSFADASSAAFAVISNQAQGTLIFSGAPDASGAHIANSGSLDVSAVTSSLSIGSLGGSGNVALGATRLTLGGLGLSDQLSGTLSGTGGINKTGAGTLTLSGQNTYTGASDVVAGTLLLSGSVASPVNVSAGATLAGGGFASGNVSIASQATLAPGQALTLHIDGNLTLSPAAALVANVAANGSASHVAVAGTATLAGAVLDINAQGVATSYQPGTTYSLLTAGLGVNGHFGTVTSSLALLEPRLTYEQNAVLLSFAQLSLPATGAGQGINSQLTSSGSAGGVASTSLIGSLDNLPASDLGSALASLSASSYATLRRFNLNESDQFAREVAAHQFSVASGYGANSAGGWINLLDRRTSSSGLLASPDVRDQGLIGGVDLYVNGTSRLALAAQMLHSAVNFGDGSNASSDRLDVGLIGTTGDDELLFTGLAAIGRHGDEINRFIAFGNYIEGPSSHPSGFNADLYGEVASEFDDATRRWMPYLGLNLAMASDDSFEEGGGGAADLFGRARRANLITTSLGVRVVQPLSTSLMSLGPNNQNWLTGALAWVHDSACTDGRVDASFLSDPQGTLFSSTTAALARSRVLASLELNAQWQHHIQVQTRLVGEAGSGTRSVEGYGGISYVW